MSNTIADFEIFKKCATDRLSVPGDRVTMDAHFNRDLGADSLDLMELVMALEEAFDVKIDESELKGVETVRQAFDLVDEKLHSKRNP